MFPACLCSFELSSLILIFLPVNNAMMQWLLSFVSSSRIALNCRAHGSILLGEGGLAMSHVAHIAVTPHTGSGHFVARYLVQPCEWYIDFHDCAALRRHSGIIG